MHFKHSRLLFNKSHSKIFRLVNISLINIVKTINHEVSIDQRYQPPFCSIGPISVILGNNNYWTPNIKQDDDQKRRSRNRVTHLIDGAQLEHLTMGTPPCFISRLESKPRVEVKHNDSDQ